MTVFGDWSEIAVKLGLILAAIAAYYWDGHQAMITVLNFGVLAIVYTVHSDLRDRIEGLRREIQAPKQ